jgi:hypothetical protein
VASDQRSHTRSVARHEERIRVTCNLPLNSTAEEKAAKKVLAYLEDLHDEPLGIQGFTHSDLYPPIFYGYWWDSEDKGWIDDKIAILIIDYKIGFRDDTSLSEKILELKKVIHKAYARYGSGQDVVWVVAHRVIRHD